LTATYDVVIVGGGPAGSAAALSLARAGCSVAILERSDYGQPRVGETLAPAVKAPLARLGLWETFQRQSPASSPAIHSAWGSHHLREQDHFYNPYGPAWHVDRHAFDALLAGHARDAGATLITSAHVLSCESDGARGWTIGFRAAQTRSSLHARGVVDATGRSSSIARHLGVRRVLHDNLVAVIGFFAPAPEHHAPRIALVEAVENGWWYSASLPDSRLVVAWMTDADLYARGGSHSMQKWLEQLDRTTHTRRQVQAAAPMSRPWIAQASSSRLDQMQGRSWLAAGDAAMAFDPLSGQGVYQALESGHSAACAVQSLLGGKPSEAVDYAERLADTFDRYLSLRLAYYSLETRWPASAFWRRRRVDLGDS
jgi:flavin-dependent dehydrogenase